MSSGWWYRASEEERLAQIDAAIELGMTAAQCALNCGCLYEQMFGTNDSLGNGGLVQGFALRRGRIFPGGMEKHKRANTGFASRGGRVMSRKQAKVEDLKASYLAGEPVDVWGSR